MHLLIAYHEILIFFVLNAYFQVNLSESESERENRGVANAPITG